MKSHAPRQAFNDVLRDLFLSEDRHAGLARRAISLHKKPAGRQIRGLTPAGRRDAFN